MDRQSERRVACWPAPGRSRPTSPSPRRSRPSPRCLDLCASCRGPLCQRRGYVLDIAEGDNGRFVRKLETVFAVELRCAAHCRLPAAIRQVGHDIIALACVDQIGPVEVQSQPPPALAELPTALFDAVADVGNVAGT